MNWNFDAGSVIVALVLLVMLMIAVRSIWNRYQLMERQQELQDFEFEAQVLSAVEAVGANDAAFIVSDKVCEDAVELPAADLDMPEARADAAPSTAAGSGDAAPLETFRQPAHVSMKGPLAQLVAANLTGTIQDYFDYHGNAQGAGSIKLKDGRTGLIVPAVESEAFLVRNLKRFDFVIMGGRDGKAYVVTSLEEFLAGQIKF